MVAGTAKMTAPAANSATLVYTTFRKMLLKPSCSNHSRSV